jgi:sortase A
MTTRWKKTILWGQRVLLVVGFAALGYCGLVVIAARRFQGRARVQMSEARIERATPVAAPTPETLSPLGPATESAGTSLIGRPDVPSVPISAMVADGTSSATLRVAVGHVPGTAMPGQIGNMVFAAHRDTFFRGLGAIRPGDIIRVTVPGKQYVYSVRFTEIVSPRETWVLDPTSHEALTLITCYPFHFIGPAPSRFVVRARRLEGE